MAAAFQLLHVLCISFLLLLLLSLLCHPCAGSGSSPAQGLQQLWPSSPSPSSLNASFPAAAAPPFPLSERSSAPPPSHLWSRRLLSSRSRPLPTNSAWLNYVLNRGDAPEYIHPYLIRSSGGAISLCYPSRLLGAAADSIVQSFVPDLSISSTAIPSSATHVVSAYDDLSVTLRFKKALLVPLVRGCPYVSFLFKGGAVANSSSSGNHSTVRLTTIHGVLRLRSDRNLTKHRLELDNGQKWLIYSSNPLELSPVDLSVSHAYAGLVRVAFLPERSAAAGKESSETAGGGGAESVLDEFRWSYPLHGHADISVPFRVKYSWRRKGSGGLLMLSLPMHRDMMTTAAAAAAAESRRREGAMEAQEELSYDSIDGEMVGMVGDSWVLHEDPISVGWHSAGGITGAALEGAGDTTGARDSDPAAGAENLQQQHPADEQHRNMDPAKNGSSSAAKSMMADALRADVGNLTPIATASSYLYGKAVARVARMALIAEETGREMAAQVEATIRGYLDRALTPWMDGSSERNGLMYDGVWGGLTTRDAAADAAADFGFGLYNDHHYHLGYLCYAAAVLARLDAAWGAKYRPQLYAMVGDYMSWEEEDDGRRRRAWFPRLRHFDLWVLHSWAAGLVEFADGRNQESTSEAAHAYYAASLVGRAFGDEGLVRTGLTLAALEARAARTLWHVPLAPRRQLYEPRFAAENRIVGVLWANKRDAGLWFAPPSCRPCRLGIHTLPLVPISAILFRDRRFARQLVHWTLPTNGTGDGWKGFVCALQALYSPRRALGNTLALRSFDDGHSLSNLLWWIFSRPVLS